MFVSILYYLFGNVYKPLLRRGAHQTIRGVLRRSRPSADDPNTWAIFIAYSLGTLDIRFDKAILLLISLVTEEYWTGLTQNE